ncbi:hypothetical protein CF15_03545 [Pyrodictium occultum]|uniref:Uncharacterized protein n=1 Tax=Pyrodictium occultum TaxID=2309 RepID=A0A0V8RV08_PYROC|nr:hypothetical protein CF15_03545 [Pyrodictium occultum]
MSVKPIELELVEEYELLGEKRYRFRVKGTSIYLNVGAESLDDAKQKAINMIKEMKLDTILSKVMEQLGKPH